MFAQSWTAQHSFSLHRRQ